MNPFDVSRFRTVNINTEHLRRLPEGLDKAAFVEKVAETIRGKFDGVNVRIVVDENAPGLFDKVLHVHDGSLDLWDLPEALGATRNLGEMRQCSLAGVDVSNFIEQVGDPSVLGAVDFSEAVGTVASHEIGHIFLPVGHSSAQESLMASGSETIAGLVDGGDYLEFTGLQKDLMNSMIGEQGNVEFMRLSGELSLGELEQTAEQVSALAENVDPALLESFGLPDLDALQLDPALWGDLEPLKMALPESLGGLDQFGEFAANFDLEHLVEAGPEGVMALFGDLENIEIAEEVGHEAIEILGDVDGEGILDFAGEIIEKIGELLEFLPF